MVTRLTRQFEAWLPTATGSCAGKFPGRACRFRNMEGFSARINGNKCLKLSPFWLKGFFMQSLDTRNCLAPRSWELKECSFVVFLLNTIIYCPENLQNYFPMKSCCPGRMKFISSETFPPKLAWKVHLLESPEACREDVSNGNFPLLLVENLRVAFAKLKL